MATVIHSRLSALSGVTRVDCRTVTGSTIVYYDPERADLIRIEDALGCDSVPARPTFAKETNEQSKLARALLMIAIEKTLERAVPALIASVL